MGLHVRVLPASSFTTFQLIFQPVAVVCYDCELANLTKTNFNSTQDTAHSDRNLDPGQLGPFFLHLKRKQKELRVAGIEL